MCHGTWCIEGSRIEEKRFQRALDDLQEDGVMATLADTGNSRRSLSGASAYIRLHGLKAREDSQFQKKEEKPREESMKGYTDTLWEVW